MSKSKSKMTSTPAGETPGDDPTRGLTGVPLALAQALLTEPGGAPALLALAAGTSRPTASRVLVAMEAQGLVRREIGERGEGNGRGPDRWYLTAVPTIDVIEQDVTSEPAPDEEGEPPAEGGELLEPFSEEVAVGEAAADTASESGEAKDHDTQQSLTGGGEARRAEGGDGGEAQEQANGCSEGTGVPGDQSEQLDNGRPSTGDSVAPSGSGPVVPPGQPCPTCGHQVRPATQRAVSGRGTRLGQGQLHELALEHMRAHPEQEWTATAVAKDIGRSSGAIANAMATMVNRGEAEMTCAAPRRYRALPHAKPASRE
ncbi:hypothetical protein ABUW04_06890 [Streptacidiphilus sp. N1-10]|uniref:MarR family transcriptional regulator n=1 Tax=Streptacidiphilus jeojiensis TaxID=3229225 RepID=A0ABV6XI88_9ACTN